MYAPANVLKVIFLLQKTLNFEKMCQKTEGESPRLCFIVLNTLQKEKRELRGDGPGSACQRWQGPGENRVFWLCALFSPNIGEGVTFLGGTGPTEGQKHRADLAGGCLRTGGSKSHVEGELACA